MQAVFPEPAGEYDCRAPCRANIKNLSENRIEQGVIRVVSGFSYRF
jgi:hypothetical protein